MGGDYFDYVPYADGRLGIVCGDVMGKGLAAALIMAMARSSCTTPPLPASEPGRSSGGSTTLSTRDLEGQRLPYFLTGPTCSTTPNRAVLVWPGRPQSRPRAYSKRHAATGIHAAPSWACGPGWSSPKRS